MSDDDSELLNTSSAFSFTGEVPPFFTRSYHRPFSSFSTETPTAFPPSTTSFLTSFNDIPLPTPTPTPGDSTLTDAFSSGTGTLGTPTPTSDDQDSPPLTSTDFDSSAPEPTDLSSSSGLPLDSGTAVYPPTSDAFSDVSSPTSVIIFPTFSSSHDPFSTFSSTPSGLPLTTDSSSPSSSTFMTSDSYMTTSSPSPTPSRIPSTSVPVPTPSPTSTSLTPLPTAVSQLSSSRSSSASSVTTAPFPSFGGGTQPATSSSTNTGTIVAATTGSVALAITVALLAILCKKRQMKRARQRADTGPFRNLDLDSELLAMNQPLIIGDGPSGGAVYTDPFTDESHTRTRSRTVSVTTGPTPSLARSGNSFQAVAGAMPIQDHRDGQAAGYFNQPRSVDQNSPPQFPSPGIVRNRSYQSLAPVHAQLMPEPPVPRQSSPPFDAGAVAYIRSNDRTPVHSPSSPGPFSPGNAEGNRLISAFSAGSGLSPRYSSPAPPPNIDEMWRNTPDPIAASSSYRPSINRRNSLALSVAGHVFEPGVGESLVLSPVDVSTHNTPRPFTDRESDMWNPYTQGGNFGSRPSPIAEVSEMPTHSQEGSNNSGGTWSSSRSVYSSISSPVVMHAQRVQLTPTVLSLVSPPTPSSGSGGSHGESLPSYGTASNLPPLPPPPPPPPAPPLLDVQPLSLGKKRSVQGIS